jgi:hypothetical protein
MSWKLNRGDQPTNCTDDRQTLSFPLGGFRNIFSFLSAECFDILRHHHTAQPIFKVCFQQQQHCTWWRVEIHLVHKFPHSSIVLLAGLAWDSLSATKLKTSSFTKLWDKNLTGWGDFASKRLRPFRREIIAITKWLLAVNSLRHNIARDFFNTTDAVTCLNDKRKEFTTDRHTDWPRSSGETD